MHIFYFNECLPAGIHKELLTIKLSNSLKYFHQLFTKNINIENALVTERLPTETQFNGYSLQNVLENIPDSELRTIAFALFYKYPICKYFDDSHNDFIEKKYTLVIDEINIDATNLAITSHNCGFLFTCGVHEALRKNPLLIYVTDYQSEVVDNKAIAKDKNEEESVRISVNNLFGEEKNTDEIESIINAINLGNLNKYGQLQAIIGNCFIDLQFEKDFSKLNNAEKDSIIEYFKHAIDRKLITRFYPDTKIVKDVSDGKANFSVYELRVYSPSAIRAYFNETDGIVYLASIGYKNEDNQNNQIKAAHRIIKRLILTN